MLRRLLARPGCEDRYRALYECAVRAGRRPGTMLALAVPDTLDGRFELLVAHLCLLLRRLRRSGMVRPSQGLVDLFVADMDRSLREVGVGDLSVGRKVRQTVSALYGRLRAYDAGLDGEADLRAALERNLYGTAGEVPPEALARAERYVRAAEAVLDSLGDHAVASGAVPFPEPDPC